MHDGGGGVVLPGAGGGGGPHGTGSGPGSGNVGTGRPVPASIRACGPRMFVLANPSVPEAGALLIVTVDRLTLPAVADELMAAALANANNAKNINFSHLFMGDPPLEVTTRRILRNRAVLSTIKCMYA